MLASLAQAGFRLMVLLEVAPELIAKEAINRIESPEQAEAIASDAVIQAQLLRSHIAVNYEANKNSLSAGKIVGENNEAVGLAFSGERHKASADCRCKGPLDAAIQDHRRLCRRGPGVHPKGRRGGEAVLRQAGALNAVRKSDKSFSKDEKYEICDTIRDAHTTALKRVDDLIARIAAK